jgi:site-specific DNA-adenine methylase
MSLMANKKQYSTAKNESSFNNALRISRGWFTVPCGESIWDRFLPACHSIPTAPG